jgi:hypothetical protein
MQEMPQPNEHHKKLHTLVGTWVGDEKLSPSPWGPGGPARGKYTMISACDGFHVVQDYVEEKDGRITYRGHGVFGWDPQGQVYTWYWVDSMGFPPPTASRGKWEGDTLIFESHSEMGHGRYTYKFDGADRLHFSLENSRDGKEYALFMEGDYQRT